MLASPKFETYRDKYPARDPDLGRKGSDDELRDVSANSDVFSLQEAPVESFVVGSPPREPASSGQQMYVWLIKESDVVLALEAGTSGQGTNRGRLAHTNLSGGKPAHAGGEVWFQDEKNIWLTGGSSRYAPECVEELNAVVSSFSESGYIVSSCGWDSDNDMPARFFREI